MPTDLSSANLHVPTQCHSSDAISEEMRCQYSSKRCENERTHKKSGGLHKFCAMHREKANRNQMRLDHRRRVVKQQQKELQRQQLAQQMHQLQMQQSLHRRRSGVAMAAAQTFHSNSHRTPRSLVSGVRRGLDHAKPMSPPNMAISMSLAMPVYSAMERQPQLLQQSTPELPLFDQRDLSILEAMLFSSDEEQSDAAPVALCNAPPLFSSPAAYVHA